MVKLNVKTTTGRASSVRQQDTWSRRLAVFRILLDCGFRYSPLRQFIAVYDNRRRTPRRTSRYQETLIFCCWNFRIASSVYGPLCQFIAVYDYWRGTPVVREDFYLRQLAVFRILLDCGFRYSPLRQFIAVYDNRRRTPRRTSRYQETLIFCCWIFRIASSVYGPLCQFIQYTITDVVPSSYIKIPP